MNQSNPKSSLALARKYRPQTFSDLLGQSHVLKALINALDSNRLHHAYLFTGTRGVGKTSIARIITKALNCEVKISSKPCLKCTNCQEIAQGSFIDLIEIDAASRTGVDDTRELMEKVQYLPVSGRYKVYLIDEVHMFSKSSFNALLKTLEEPPSHVIFLLATTDPEKIPITVLSRCLQFNLKRIKPEVIESQFKTILKAEKIKYDPASILSLAKAADGSMRDGLSLLDQAIAYGNGEVIQDTVEKMLGSVSGDKIESLIYALASGDCKSLLEQSQVIYDMGLNYHHLFDELLATFHQISMVHLSGSVDFIEPIKRDAIEKYTQIISKEQCQLFYEIGRKALMDLNYATHEKVAFDMAMFRMAFFTPESMLSEKQTSQLQSLNHKIEQKKNS